MKLSEVCQEEISDIISFIGNFEKERIVEKIKAGNVSKRDRHPETLI